MLIYVYDEVTKSIRKYNKRLTDQMPFSKNKYLSVKEFRGNSKSNIIWTSKQTIESFNKFRSKWGKPIYVGFAFQRITRGGHTNQSQHYAGTALDIAQNLSNNERKKLYNLAKKMNIWSYVEPINMTPRWIHIDKRYGKAACGAGYPTLKINSRGNYVFVLQETLQNNNYNVSMDGIYGSKTLTATKNYQRKAGLSNDGIVGCKTWRSLVE